MFIWERQGWPSLRWDERRLLEPLAAARHRQGLLLGHLRGQGFAVGLDARLQAHTDEVVQSSAIEGDPLDPRAVRSSIARHLGIPDAGLVTVDRRTDGIVEMMLDATGHLDAPLTRERLFGWQAALFPTGYAGRHPVRTGGWRDDAEGPMQVVSGPIGRGRVHFRAPPASRVDSEMDRFLGWFDAEARPEGLLRAGLAHLWFVTVHPFDDGNGRLARAIADRALAQSEGSVQRFYSMSSQIREERARYYEMLERTQRGGLDVTDWLQWFLGCFERALERSEVTLARVFAKADFWRRFADEPLGERQRKVLNRLLDGFEGRITAKKWAALGKVSIPTAQRDLNDLLARGLLARSPGGSKNTSYTLAFGTP
ncbi:MAG: Fic family protein [Myxococcota bacterium]